MTDKPVAYFLAKILLSIVLLCGSSVIQAKTELVLSGCPQEAIALTPFFQIVHDNTGLMRRGDIEQLADSQWQPQRILLLSGLTINVYRAYLLC